MNEEIWLKILVSTVIPALLILFIWLSIRARRKQRMIDNIPTSKTAGVFIGLVEVKGTAEAEQPLRSFLAETPCVHYAYSVQEHWRRTVRETYTDSKGKSRTRTRTESGWKTLDSETRMMPFYLKDDTGILRIVPDQAQIEPSVVFDHSCGRSDPLYYGKGPQRSVMNSTHRRRFVERAIPIHTPIYVIGRSREREDVVAPEIAHDPEAPLFLISTRPEEKIRSGYRLAFWLWFILGLIGAGFGAWGIHTVLTEIEEYPVGWGLGAVGAYFTTWFIAWAWMVYNSMIDLKNRVDRAASLIDIQLKRRHDLIPRLVSIVSAMKNHETRVQEQLALLRTQARANAPGESGPDPRACRGSLLAIAEHYPELSANSTFVELQKGLIGTEQRIALARSFYNDIASQMNNRVECFPDSLFARLGGMKQRKLMEAADFERAVVQVDLSD